MGSGKGTLEYWVAVVKPGRVLFEIAGVPEDAWAVGRFGGGADHPLLMTYPEGEYLKGLDLLVRP